MENTQTLINDYPDQATLFYGYPGGAAEPGEGGIEHGFHNLVPFWVEMIVAARLGVCITESGSQKIVVFGPSAKADLLSFMRNELGVPLIPNILERMLVIAPDLPSDASPTQRNAAIASFLNSRAGKGELIMAQPFMQGIERDRYVLDPNITLKLSDKRTLSDLVPAKNLPERYREWPNGAAFASDEFVPPLPCVVKVCASSSGDGVRVCRDAAGYAAAKSEFSKIGIPIIVERCVAIQENLGVQFSIGLDGTSFEIKMVSEQIIGPQGDFKGGLFDRDYQLDPKIRALVLNQILPKIAARGYRGWGSLDFIVDSDGGIFVTDLNPRFTANSSAMDWKLRFNPSRITTVFNGRLHVPDPKPILVQLTRARVIQVLALVEAPEGLNMSVALLGESRDGVVENAREAQRAGLRGSGLEALLTA